MPRTLSDQAVQNVVAFANGSYTCDTQKLRRADAIQVKSVVYVMAAISTQSQKVR